MFVLNQDTYAGTNSGEKDQRALFYDCFDYSFLDSNIWANDGQYLSQMKRSFEVEAEVEIMFVDFQIA